MSAGGAIEQGRSFVSKLFAAIDQQLWDELPLYFAAECCYERPGYPPIHGIAAILEFYREVRIVASGRHTIEGIVASDNTVVCWGGFCGVSRVGDALSERFADIYWLADARIVHRRSFFFRPAM